MRNKILIGAGLSACAMAWATKDPVIMTVNGVDVPKSEFEYLYHKNSQQQMSPQPLEEYAEMFKIYKLKVADAKANGIDTTAQFVKEMRQYRNELAAPYLADSLFIQSLIDEAAARGLEEVEASHIMMMKTRDASENMRSRNKLDSIRKVLLSGGDFTDLAVRFSQDRSVAGNKGYLGYISSGRFPYEFETAVYTLPEGGVSEVIESPAGYHIVKSGKRRASRGRVNVSHIMKMVPKDASEKVEAETKAAIDSIYRVVKADQSKFAELAKEMSDDKGSARQGGKLPTFGSGEMVPEFETVSFALADGEVSEPVRSQFGWHIILKHGKEAPQTAESLKPELLRRISNPQDGRFKLVKENRTRRLAEKHKAKIYESNVGAILSRAGENGVDSLFVASYISGPLSQTPIASIDGKDIPASEMFKSLTKLKIEDPAVASDAIRTMTDGFYSRQLVDAEENWLYDNNADYRNLLNEYNDGSLLYEISVRKVWDKASKDTEGLQRYFDTHRADYRWKEPHAKGILVQTTNDSLAAVIKGKMKELHGDSVAYKIKKEFTGKAKVDKILATKGTNPMVDNIMFGGPEVNTSAEKFPVYFLYDAKVIEAPESMEDVRGQVTSDYQNQLETEWITELEKKYPVKINKKELKKIK